jgi:DNA-binding transcriptional LysR family regulator
VAIDRSSLGLDLNLLVTLDALLRIRNVTHAAAELGLSQPAVSAALGRLRRHFRDELLVRQGNRFELTPLAAQLVERTPSALATARRIFDASPDFDSATASREFTLMMSDYAVAVLAPLVSQRISQEAPGVRLRLSQISTPVIDRATESLRDLDGVVLPHGYLSGLPHVDLFEDEWVCIVSADNPDIEDQPTTETLAALPWVVLMDRPTAYSPAAHQLRMMGIQPRVEVVVDVFLTMPFLVEGTGRVALVQRRLASRMRGLGGVRLLPCPDEVRPMRDAFWWHPTYTSDPGHQWLRATLVAAGRQLGGEPAIDAADG